MISNPFLLIIFIITGVFLFPNFAFGQEFEQKQEYLQILYYDPIGFSLEYPKFFELHTSKLKSEGWLFSLNSTLQEIDVDVYALPLESELDLAQKTNIVDYIFLLNFIECQQSTLNQTGYQCFNFSPLDSDIKIKNNAEFYEVTYSILTKDTEEQYENKIKVVTDIWFYKTNSILSIHGIFNEKQYLEKIPIYERIIDSIDLNIEEKPVIEIPIKVKVNAALWNKDILTTQEFFEDLSSISNGVKIKQNSKNAYIPIWFKNTCQWWIDGLISDSEYHDSVVYLYGNKIIHN